MNKSKNHYKYNKDIDSKKNDIIKLYKELKSVKSISIIYGVSESLIDCRLKKWGIKRYGRKVIISEKERKDIVNIFKETGSIHKIKEKYSYDYPTLLKYLELWGIIKRKPVQCKLCKKLLYELGNHLQSYHKINIKQYKEIFPNSLTYCLYKIEKGCFDRQTKHFFDGIYFSSKQEILCYQFLRQHGLSKTDINYNFQIGRKRIDFFLYNKVFWEHHPTWREGESLERYYNTRRKLLNRHGYKGYKLIITTSLVELYKIKDIIQQEKIKQGKEVIKIVCEFSGGSDSVLAAIRLQQKYNVELYPVFFNYGHASGRFEELTAKRLVKRLRLNPLKIIEIKNLYDKTNSLVSGRNVNYNSKIGLGLSTVYTPLRNVVLIGCSAAYMESVKADGICVGSKSFAPTDNPYSFRDSNYSFYMMMEGVINHILEDQRKIKIYTPLIENRTSKLTKIEVYKELKKNGICIDDTHNCFSNKKFCGICENCKVKIKLRKEIEK